MIVSLALHILAPDNQLIWTLAIAINQTTYDPKPAIDLYHEKVIVQP